MTATDNSVPQTTGAEVVSSLRNLKTAPVSNFSEDKLGRKPCADMITKLIEGTDGSLVIGLNGAWGTGKTTFLKMWQNELSSENYQTIYFNAWEDDYCKDPLVAIIGQLWEHFKYSKFKSCAEFVKKAALPLLDNIASKALSVATHGVVPADAQILRLLSQASKSSFNEYEEAGKSVRNLKEKLKELSNEVSESGKPLVFFIDELDRCRPTFAIELLERVKHIFDISGIYFVLGIDREQLGHSIRSVYGQGMDVDGYLRRFVDIEFKLPNADTGVFCEHIFKQYGISEVRLTGVDGSSVAEIFDGLSPCFDMSLRDIEHFCRMIVVVYMNNGGGMNLQPHLVVLFLLLRLYKTQLYYDFKSGRATGEEVIKLIYNEPNCRHFMDTLAGKNLEASLIVLSPAPWRNKVLNELDSVITTGAPRPTMSFELLRGKNREDLTSLWDKCNAMYKPGLTPLWESELHNLYKSIELTSSVMQRGGN